MHKVEFKLKKNFVWEKEKVEGIYLDTISIGKSVKDDESVDVVYYNGNVYWLSKGKVVKTINVVE